jgi:o-succinylbenzoate synthase
MSELSSMELFPFRIPMKLRFRRVMWREGVVIRGPAGWGEFSPFPDYPPEVTVRWLAAALEAACSPWPQARRSMVPVNVTVPAVAPDIAAELVARSGCTTAKVKVAEPGQSAAEDLDRVAAVREALGPRGKLRVDVNAAWTVPEAIERIEALEPYGLEYVEQPVRTIDELAEVRAAVNVLIAADEAVRLAADPMRVVDHGAADILVLKPQPMGGVRRALDLARRSGLPIVVSSALETSIGLAAGVALAAALPELPYACGLGTASLLEGDLTEEPLTPEWGAVRVRRPEPSEELLQRWTADRETESRVMRRLRQASEILT